MQKLKPHHDAEFLVIGHRPAPKRQHLTVLTCRNDLNSATFDVLFPGLLHEPTDALDHMLTVQFSGRTDSLLPRFPVAVRLRDDRAIEPASAPESWAEVERAYRLNRRTESVVLCNLSNPRAVKP